MIILTVDGILGKKKTFEDFHIKKITTDAECLGSNVMMLLKIEKDDDPKMVLNTIYRIKSRFGDSFIYEENSGRIVEGRPDLELSELESYIDFIKDKQNDSDSA